MRNLKFVGLLTLILLLFLAACQQDADDQSDEGEGDTSEMADQEAAAESVREAPTAVPSPTPLPTPIFTADELLVTAGGHAEPITTRIVYIVQYGDTLTGIANKYGVSAKALADANRIYNYDLIKVGDEIYIPPREPFLNNNYYYSYYAMPWVGE